MQRVLIENPTLTNLYENHIDYTRPIFALRGDKVCGMVVKEDDGWILRIGGGSGCCGYFPTRNELMYQCATHYDYDFFVEE